MCLLFTPVLPFFPIKKNAIWIIFVQNGEEITFFHQRDIYLIKIGFRGLDNRGIFISI
jgi:hypothetical protein